MNLSLFVLVSATAHTVTWASPATVQRLPVYDPPKAIELSQVPRPALDAAAQELAGIPKANITCTARRDDDGQIAYEFSALDAVGAEHVAGFTADGTPALLGAEGQFDTASFANSR